MKIISRLQILKYCHFSIIVLLGYQINESRPGKYTWEWMRSETASLADLGYAQLRCELDNMRQKHSQVLHELESVKRDVAEMQQTILRIAGHPSLSGKLFESKRSITFNLFIVYGNCCL